MAAVAERLWKAFWHNRGTPLAQISDGLDVLLKADGAIPFALVAEIDGWPCGNALVIDNDESARPILRHGLLRSGSMKMCAGRVLPAHYPKGR